MGEVYEKALKRRDLSGVVLGEATAGAGAGAGAEGGKKTDKEKKEEKSGGKGSTGKIVQLMTSDTGK